MVRERSSIRSGRKNKGIPRYLDPEIWVTWEDVIL